MKKSIVPNSRNIKRQITERQKIIFHSSKIITEPLEIITLCLTSLTLVTGLVLSSTRVSADTSAVDNVAVTVPVSCSLSATVNTEHTATLNNGIYSVASTDYANGIGKTTLTAFCNDPEGFAIYAIGYTGEEEGVNILIGANTGNAIDTAVYASGDTTSSWAMKLNSVSGTYAPIIAGSSADTEAEEGDTDFSSYSEVPDEWTKVAYKTSGTDIEADGYTATGAKLETAYVVYISQAQAADTYNGKVKYTLVHPNDADAPVKENQIAVTYNGNGLTFASGLATNKVTYGESCTTEYGYVGTTAAISKSSNVNEDGTQNGPIATGDDYGNSITISGADMLKVVLTYDIDPESTEEEDAIGNISVSGDNWVTATSYYGVGTETIYVHGDTVYFWMYIWGAVNSGHDYGYYALVYPVYEEETSETVYEEFPEVCIFGPLVGAYATTTNWHGSWYANINGAYYDFLDESEVTAFVIDNYSTLGGTTVDLYRSLTINEALANANKTQTNGYYAIQDVDNDICHTIAIGQNGTVIDNRDNNTYLIGRLADGRCWMLDNLALDPTDATTAANMNASNTNAPAAAIANFLNGGSTDNAGWSSVAVVNETSETSSWGETSAYYTEPRVNNQSKDAVVTSYGAGSGNVGIYYNYCAATVGTYCYEKNQGIDVANTYIDAPYDVCPANWRMPTGGPNGEYYVLYNKYNTTVDATNSASLQYNLSTPLSGIFSFDDPVYSQDILGAYWSSTYFNEYSIYGLSVAALNVYPDNSADYRFGGQTVRCLVSN